MSNSTSVKTILILAANPANTSPLRLDKEVREIDEGLRRANKREEFKLEQKWAVRTRDFYRAILDYQPQIVHFCGHGAGSDGIVLEDEIGQAALISADVLGSMFELFATIGVECVLLNACYSLIQAEAISQYINYVIGMTHAVEDTVAITFSVAFYDAIGAGNQIEFAYNLGCSQVRGLLSQQTLVLKKKLLITSVVPKIEIIPPNPYQGLSAFGEEDASFFFGREIFVNTLVQTTHQQPLVAVIGPSGSGKSSVVFAGLIPRLRTQGDWLIESIRPSNQPYFQMALALVRQLVPEAGEIQHLQSAAGLAKNIQKGLVTLPQIVSRIMELHPNKGFLLFVDQFEELYTFCQKEEQERFIDTLLQAIENKTITLVLTLRADFYGFALSHRPFRDALQQFIPQLVSSMNREELQTAISQPAQKLLVQFEAQLQERILDDVGLEPGNLPLLEFALTRLWSKQQNRLLTHARYDEIGGVKKALANHAEQVYQKLSETEQKAAQRIFVQLVRPGEGTEDTRRVAKRAEVGDENWELVSYLAGYTARLVVTGRDEKSFEDTVEVVHEALIREWLTLREWMKKDRSFRAWQERMRIAIHQWEDTKRDEGALLRGVSLAEAKERLKERRQQLSPSEQDFIQQSLQLSDLLRQQEKVRRRNQIAGVSGAALLIITTLGLTALYQSIQAKINSAKSNDYSQAFIDVENGDKKGPLKRFNHALRLDPNDPQLYYNLAATHYHLGENKDALKDYSKCLDLDPHNALAYYNRGLVRSNLKDLKGALDDYNHALQIDPHNAKAYNNRGIVHSNLGDLKGVLDDYNHALQINPNYDRAYNNRGLVRSNLGDLKGALEDYNHALQINPNYDRAYYNRGLVRSNLGDLKGALEDYNHALQIDSNDAVAYNNRGLVRSNLEDLKGALEDYNHALQIDPKYAQVYNNRGIVRSNLGDKKGALNDYNHALQIDPKYAQVYNNRGIVRSNLGDKKGALDDYNHALQINPNYAKAYNNRGRLLKE